MAEVTRLTKLSDTAPTVISLAEVHRITTEPASRLARQTYMSRKLRSEGRTEEANRLKSSTGLYIPSGIYVGGHGKECLRSMSCLVLSDFDHVPPERMNEVVHRIRADPHTALESVSNSAEGIHVVSPFVLLDEHGQAVAPEHLAWDETLPHPDYLAMAEAIHAEAYETAMSHYEQLLDWPRDTQTSNINRGSFFSHDPEAYYCAAAAPFAISLESVRHRIEAERLARQRAAQEQRARAKARLKTHGGSVRHTNPFDIVESWVERDIPYVEGSRNLYMFRCCSALHQYGMDSATIAQWADARFADLTARERSSTVRSACKGAITHPEGFR